MKTNRAFTLIELSIVLVIIGLIIGGVLVGKDLIQAAQMRRFISTVEKINTATLTFKLKYNAIPGDMADAYIMFGSSCSGSGGSAADYCNGDGNGFLNSGHWDWYSYDLDTERCMFWKQLGLSGLLEFGGNYDCITRIPVQQRAPLSPFNPNAYYIISAKCPSGSVTTNCNDASKFLTDGNYLYSGGDYVDTPTEWVRCGGIPSATNPTHGGRTQQAFKPDQLFYFDTKVDDGMPMTGNLIVPERVNCAGEIAAVSRECVAADGTYEIAVDQLVCHMRLKMAF